MEVDQENILKVVRQTQILLAFKTFTERVDSDPTLRRIIITLLNGNEYANHQAIRNIFNERFDFELLNDSEYDYMLKLVQAHLRMSNTRRPGVITDEKKAALLRKQNYRCVFCGATVDSSSPVDHIVPFKYVGDELDDNYQILCISCNSKKNKQLTYQLQIILQGGLK